MMGQDARGYVRIHVVFMLKASSATGGRSASCGTARLHRGEVGWKLCIILLSGLGRRTTVTVSPDLLRCCTRCQVGRRCVSGGGRAADQVWRGRGAHRHHGEGVDGGGKRMGKGRTGPLAFRALCSVLFKLCCSRLLNPSALHAAICRSACACARAMCATWTAP